MTPQTCKEIVELLLQAQQRLPVMPSFRDKATLGIQQRLKSLEIDLRNMAQRLERETQKQPPKG